MSGRKSNLSTFQNIVAGDMSQTTITSTVTNIEFLDNIGIQLNWSGTSPVGTAQVQVSADYEQDMFGNVTNAGHWVAMTLSPSPSISGNTGSIYIDINQHSAPWMRVVYTKGSGVGTLNGFITAKMV